MSNEPIIKNPLVIVPEKVDSFATQNKIVTPSREKKIVRADLPYDALASVEVNPIPPEYNEYDVYNGEAEGAESELIGYKLEERRTVSPQQGEALTVKANKAEGFDGIEEVIVRPIPPEYTIVSGELEIIANGEWDVSQYAMVNVDVTGGGATGINAQAFLNLSTTIITEADQDEFVFESSGEWGGIRLGTGAFYTGAGSLSGYLSAADVYLYWTRAGRISINRENNQSIGAYGALLIKSTYDNNTLRYTLEVHAVGNPTEILGISTNGEYNIAGYKGVSVNVPSISMSETAFTENGEYTAQSNTAWDKVTVLVDKTSAFHKISENLTQRDCGSSMAVITADHGGLVYAVDIESGALYYSGNNLNIDRNIGKMLFIHAKDDTLDITVNGSTELVNFAIAKVEPLTSSLILEVSPTIEYEGAWEIGSTISDYKPVVDSSLTTNDLGLVSRFASSVGDGVTATVTFQNGERLEVFDSRSSNPSYIRIYSGANSILATLYTVSDGPNNDYTFIDTGNHPYKIMNITATGVVQNVYTATEIATIVGKWLREYLTLVKRVYP